MRFQNLKMPAVLGVKLSERTLHQALAIAERRGFKIGDIFEAFPQKNARYIGLKMQFPA